MSDHTTKTSDEETKENLNIRAIDHELKGDTSHMGAKESQVNQKKPPTNELGKLSGEPMDKGKKKKDSDYDPVDEITPG